MSCVGRCLLRQMSDVVLADPSALPATTGSAHPMRPSSASAASRARYVLACRVDIGGTSADNPLLPADPTDGPQQYVSIMLTARADRATMQSGRSSACVHRLHLHNFVLSTDAYSPLRRRSHRCCLRDGQVGHRNLGTRPVPTRPHHEVTHPGRHVGCGLPRATPPSPCDSHR